MTYSALKPDLLSFPEGIGHRVGENGVVLAEGQEARVALARGLYQRSDVYLFDDIFKSMQSSVS